MSLDRARICWPAPALRLIGLVLLPFPLGLWLNARRPAVSRGEARIAVLLDLGWVAASAALPLADLWPLAPAGRFATLLLLSSCSCSPSSSHSGSPARDP